MKTLKQILELPTINDEQEYTEHQIIDIQYRVKEWLQEHLTIAEREWLKEENKYGTEKERMTRRIKNEYINLIEELEQ